MNLGHRLHLLALAGGSALALISTPATAAPVLTTVNQDISSQPFQFCYLGSCFNVTGSGTGGFAEILGIQTTGSAAASSFFGSPSVSFTNRGTVTYGPEFGAFSSFPTTEFARFSNGENFLGLRVTSGGQDYYGFLFTTGTASASKQWRTPPSPRPPISLPLRSPNRQPGLC